MEELPDIESIIESRKQQIKFAPITRIKDIDSDDEAEQSLEE